MLKVKGTGGSGHNMFAVTESSSGFETVPNYNYREGDAKFTGYVTQMISVGGKLLLAFNNGKMLKVKGTGGSGHNMFAVTESSSGFETVPNYNYREGDAKFTGYVTDLEYIPNTNISIISFSNGKSIKIKDIGGTGHNMFALKPCRSTFVSVPGYDYYLGIHKF